MLSAIYIKGFKTFARPVRMPLERGVTAIVGPNGSGKSNVTDAVLFALGEGSPSVLRAGAMGELIFAGSEALPAANAAEVTLVFDNGDGRISLPYEEVSVARRISRDGETEYRINGSRARLSDVRAVAGEAGLGRHSVLRQGSVDAIVAGGAAACRLALEEAAGLGVYRRRRLSASRRLERADAQLEQSRQLEAELAGQLRRIEAEAVAAREYRELEARYRSLSLARLYRVATRGLEGLRRQAEAGRAKVGELSGREETLRLEEAALERRLRGLQERLRETEGRLEGVEDGAEDLRVEALRADRALLRLETARGREGERRRLVSRLEEELRRVSHALAELDRRTAEAEAGHAALREAAAEARRALAEARSRGAEAEKERSRLAAALEGVRTRLARSSAGGERRAMPEGEISRLRALASEAEEASDGRPRNRLDRLRRALDGLSARVGALDEEAGRRRGALAAAVGRADSRVRALKEAAPGQNGTRLYEVIRARPGYELAVEAALGEYGAGVLAANLEEGVRLLSGAERVAVRLDAEGAEKNGAQPGKPLLECVEVVDGRYADAVGRLLGGIYVVDRPEHAPPTNGYVAVTTEGLRLTRTGVSLRSGGAFAREARLSEELERLEALKGGPGETLYEARARLSGASGDLQRLAETAQHLSALAGRASRAGGIVAREGGRRAAAAERRRKDLEEREEASAVLALAERETAEALAGAEAVADRVKEEVGAAAEALDAARSAAEESGRRLTGLRAAVSEGENRRAKLSRRLEEVGRPVEGEAEARERVVGRVARAAATLAGAVRERRGALRGVRSGLAEEHRGMSERRTALAHEAAGVAGELAAARVEAERYAERVARAEAMAEEAAEEIRSEWGATLEVARREAEGAPGDTDAERQRLARRLKRFGDVNLLALSQETALRERHEFVAAQRADAEAAAGELQRVILSVDSEIEARFSQMFGRVRAAFGEMVPRMMEGSTGVLELSEDGVEIGLRLGRKGWRPLRVLSGGERALLALSFLFAIFLSLHEEGAGTFCVLDEAEAALDDLNLARFLAVVDSNRSSGQYLLVTHQKRTMAAADVLYGVVQDASGATTVVSKRMRGE